MKWNKAWSLPALLLVLPFLVGHGIGCVSDCPPTEYGYDLAGAAPSEADRRIQHTGRVKLLQGEQLLAQTAGFGVSSPVLTFHVEETPLSNIRLAVDAQAEIGQLGSLWLNSTKLLHAIENEQTGVFVDLVFSLREMPADMAWDSTIAASVDYVLSSDHAGANYLTLGRKAKLSSNDGTVLLNSYDGTATVFAPLYFSATAGDTLTLELEFDGGTTETTALWLHRPDGSGTKLLHQLEPQADKTVRLRWTLP